MCQKPDIEAFYLQHREPYRLVALLQVGSSARGYALDSSDVDLMAFYEAGPQFTSYPIHKREAEVSFTLEHHDLNRFLSDTADYRFNLGSLRQLHKVRDAVVVLGSPVVEQLDGRAKKSHLDRSVLLRALAEVANRFSGMTCSASVEEYQQILRWTELLATLDLVSVANRSAFSKPKWLLQALRESFLDDAVLLLGGLDSPTRERLETVATAVRNILSLSPMENCPDAFRILIKTAANDVQSMLRLKPEESLPAARFFAFQVLRSIRAAGAADQRAEIPSISEILTPNPALELHAARLAFHAFAERIARELVDEYASATASAIGTRRFYTHYLATYEATNLLPHNSMDMLRQWVEEISTVFLGDSSGAA